MKGEMVAYTTMNFSEKRLGPSWRDEWLRERNKHIGASDAGAVLGISPWKSNVVLWQEKVGETEPAPLGGAQLAACKRGSEAEAHIRELYRIETGKNIVDGTGTILVSTAHPFMSCTLDAIDRTNEDDPTVIEIKDSANPGAWTKDRMPQQYYVQILHQLAVTGWSSAMLLARITSCFSDIPTIERRYFVKREDVKEEIKYLIGKEKEFWDGVVARKRPNLIIPED